MDDIISIASIAINMIQLTFFIIVMSNRSVGSLIMSMLTKKTWLQYERLNGAITPLPVKLEDGTFEDKRHGMFVVTPGSTKLLEGGIKTAHAYEGLASTIPTKFALSCQKANDMGIENVQQLVGLEQTANDPKEEPSLIEEAKRILKTIDFSHIRNFFLYDFTPRGMRAMVNRKVAIELQKEKTGGLAELILSPAFLISAAVLIVIIGTVVYPAISNQQAITLCQSKLTQCLAVKTSGVSVS